MKLPKSPSIPALPRDKSYHIVGLGTNVVDRVALVERIVRADEKVLVRNLETHPGGAVCNNLAQAARLGLHTAWVGFVGDDPEARYLLSEMKACGVDSRHARAVKGKRSSVSWIAVGPDGERGIYMFPNVNGQITPGHVDRHFASAIRKAVHFHTETAQNRLDTVVRAMRVAKDAGARVFFDLDVPPEDVLVTFRLGTADQLDEALSLTDVVKACRPAALGLTRRKDLEGAAMALLGRGPSIVAITSGSSGALLATRREMVKAPAIPMRAKDTTGAGDAFMGGLSFALLCGEPLARAGLIANACAAYCVARTGSRSQGSYDDIRALLRTIPEY